MVASQQELDRRYKRFSTGRRLHGGNQVFVDARLDYVTQGSSQTCSFDNFGIVLYRTHHYGRPPRIGGQLPGDLYAIEPRHFKIQNDHIGARTANTFQRGLSVGGSIDNIKFGSEQPSELR